MTAEPKQVADYCFPPLKAPENSAAPAAAAHTPEKPIRQAANESYAHGFAHGRRLAGRKERRRFAPLRTLLQQICLALEDQNKAPGRLAEQIAARLAVSAAREMIRQELARSPERCKAIARHALLLGQGLGNLCLKIHPVDRNPIQDLIAEMTVHAQLGAPVQIVSDAAIEPGGCLIESDFGIIDARIDTQLADLEKELERFSGRARQPGTATPAKPDFEALRNRIEETSPVRPLRQDLDSCR